MPELPEIEALAGFLRERLVGEAIIRVGIAEINLLKTVDPPLAALYGLEITGVERAGMALVIEFDGLDLVCRFARAGWLAWHETVPRTPLRPGRGPIGMRVSLVSGAGFDLREAGTKKNASVALVADRAELPAIGSAGPDALAIDLGEFTAILASTTSRIKTVLEDQTLLAGIGNGWSDEILHRAQLSPFASAQHIAAQAPAVVALHAALVEILAEAVAALGGLAPSAIKTAKKELLRVHGRTGFPCPVCGTPIAEVSFAERSFHYCPGCQTGGKRLSDRRMDRLLR